MADEMEFHDLVQVDWAGEDGELIVKSPPSPPLSFHNVGDMDKEEMREKEITEQEEENVENSSEVSTDGFDDLGVSEEPVCSAKEEKKIEDEPVILVQNPVTDLPAPATPAMPVTILFTGHPLPPSHPIIASFCHVASRTRMYTLTTLPSGVKPTITLHVIADLNALFISAMNGTLVETAARSPIFLPIVCHSANTDKSTQGTITLAVRRGLAICGIEYVKNGTGGVFTEREICGMSRKQIMSIVTNGKIEEDESPGYKFRESLDMAFKLGGPWILGLLMSWLFVFAVFTVCSFHRGSALGGVRNPGTMMPTNAQQVVGMVDRVVSAIVEDSESTIKMEWSPSLAEVENDHPSPVPSTMESETLTPSIPTVAKQAEQVDKTECSEEATEQTGKAPEDQVIDQNLEKHEADADNGPKNFPQQTPFKPLISSVALTLPAAVVLPTAHAPPPQHILPSKTGNTTHTTPLITLPASLPTLFNALQAIFKVVMVRWKRGVARLKEQMQVEGKMVVEWLDKWWNGHI
ncbi:uncharacterized protein SPPG_08765 [Spizellomyces punctatus DAOM BR117]|uniref:Uncharacterized protein n=1 Tax=Spizellomyces punctatus (strain DAOM BR117) TaxID=645134 RepID=A0A0L0H2Z5_SPIPD|nr:uncharacterized protein SPPG_08765 [Spizellomyces punctatus DAOM BR117]KNC95825.1 hypothetical protein SPPG_08765 [Spizellomyces punctatus DAOM BR117]|eukprot:XP_016603865.1 hypothetical protein SPPG_08765 [Spizellomyces punctatus DAOM BR117]